MLLFFKAAVAWLIACSSELSDDNRFLITVLNYWLSLVIIVTILSPFKIIIFNLIVAHLNL